MDQSSLGWGFCEVRGVLDHPLEFQVQLWILYVSFYELKQVFVCFFLGLGAFIPFCLTPLYRVEKIERWKK